MLYACLLAMLSLTRGVLQQFADRPRLVSQAARHRRRSPIQRFMLRGEVVPREEKRLLRYVVLWALAVSIGQPSEARRVHPNREVHRLDMRRANPLPFPVDN